MKPLLVLLKLIFVYSILASPVFAASSPSLLEPSNNSTISDTSPKLSWEYRGNCSASGKCFRVLVDDSSDFSSPEKDYYTDNKSYSPSLGSGSWNFKVKAKDETNNWSDFSETYSFTISDNSSGGQEETSTASPTSPPSLSTDTTDSFLISQVPHSINSTDEFNVAIQISGLQASSTYYLKGAFVKSGSSNYFGKTSVSGNFIKNSETFSKQFSFTTDNSGSFNGELKIMVDPDDSGFTGSGTYNFKVGRYNSSGSGPTWSNESVINITDNTPKETTKSSKSTTTAKAADIPDKTPTKAVSQKPVTPFKSAAMTTKQTAYTKLPEVAGISTTSAEASPETSTTVAGSIKFNWWFIGGGILSLIASLSSFVYMIKKR